MRQERRGFGSGLVFLLIAIGLLWLFNSYSAGKIAEQYSRDALIKDIEAGNVVSVRIQLNEETPTGALYVELTSGGSKILYVSTLQKLKQQII